MRKISTQGNLTGRDNRSSFVGGTQFPTESSKQQAQKSLNKTIQVAEKGPAPSMTKVKMPSSNVRLNSWQQPKVAGVLMLEKYLQSPKGVAELTLTKLAQSQCLDTYYANARRDTEKDLKELFLRYKSNKLFL